MSSIVKRDTAERENKIIINPEGERERDGDGDVFWEIPQRGTIQGRSCYVWYGHLNERALPDFSARIMVTERCKTKEYAEFRTQLVINPYTMMATRYLTDYHHSLLRCFSYDVVRYKSEVYFLGGEFYGDYGGIKCSNKVFVKTPGSGWEVNDMPHMQSPRIKKQILIWTPEQKVMAVLLQPYVKQHGCSTPGITFNVPALPRHEWAECYDFKSKKWTYLPKPPRATHLEACYKILVWVSFSPGVFAYDYIAQKWTTFTLPIDISPVSDRSSSYDGNRSSWYGNVVAVGNVLIWYLQQVIYVYDIIQLCEIKRFIFKISPDFTHDGSSYLYSLGDGMMFLLLWNGSNMFFVATLSYDKDFNNIYHEASAFIPTSAAYDIEAPWACVLIL